MFTHDTQIRVRYAETHQKAVFYHSKYFPSFESSRAEAIRSLGYTYAQLEKEGVIMPVVDVHCRYLRPALYDELLTVRTLLKELPVHHKIEFYNEVYNEKNELLASAKIILYFMESKTMKRTTMPENMLNKLKPFFKQQ